MFVSSNQLSRPSVFEGYAWVGNNLVVSQGGADLYFSETGEKISPGEDGCYVVLEDFPDGLRIGTDYRGLMRLFIYRSGNDWAISSSLYELVTNVRSLNWTLTVLEDTVSAYLSGVGFSSQLAAFGAHYAEVTLVPSDFSVLITDERLTLEFREPERAVPYDAALYDFVVTWKNRLSTLTSNMSTSLKFDLSGGIDSRAVIAFAIADGNILKDSSRCRIESSTKPSAAKDFEVASEIADNFGFELNSRTKPKNSSGYSGAIAIDGWKQHSLAVYSPVYLYGSVVTPHAVHAHGAGGGNFRPTYSSIGGKLSPLKPELTSADHRIWGQRVVNDITALGGFYENVSLELLHYREFRNRFHFGHRPQQNFVYMPLESKLTDPITDRCDERDGRQFYYDVMESLQPGLSRFKYDSDEKFPSEANVSQLTVVDTPNPLPGKIFYVSHNELAADSSKRDVFGEWMESSASRLGTELVAQVLPPKYFSPAQSAIRGWQRSEEKPSANSLGMKGLSHALAIDFLLDSSSKI